MVSGTRAQVVFEAKSVLGGVSSPYPLEVKSWEMEL